MHMTCSSTSSVTMKIPIKTTMRYHVTLGRMAMKIINKCWQGHGETETLIHCWWECKMAQSLWKSLVVPQRVKHKINMT